MSLRNFTQFNKAVMMVAMTLIVLIVAKTQFFSSPLASQLFWSDLPQLKTQKDRN